MKLRLMGWMCFIVLQKLLLSNGIRLEFVRNLSFGNSQQALNESTQNKKSIILHQVTEYLLPL